MTLVIEKKECRVCGKELPEKNLLDFGEQAIVDFIDGDHDGRGSAPLQLVQCSVCRLIQLRHTVDADTLYRKFWYRSSMNEQMRSALSDVVMNATKKVMLVEDDFVCDIGSNDGELLLNYPSVGIAKVGFEPAILLAQESVRRFVARKDMRFEVIPGYFNAIEALAVSHGRMYKIVTAIAMFYDLDDPVSFLHDVKAILAPDGVFVIQMNYLNLMIRNLTFDNVSHEHLCYYSLSNIAEMLESVGLGIFDVELNAVNGGSIRIYATHKEVAFALEAPSVKELLEAERIQLTEQAVQNFVERVEATMSLLLLFLIELRNAGKKVYAYGASTRGTTLLQVLFRNEKATDYIVATAERAYEKFGRQMAGVKIPICSEELARREADYMLLLPYHFWPSIREREKAWMKRGGKFILPLPYPKVVSLEEEGLVAQDLAAVLETM